MMICKRLNNEGLNIFKNYIDNSHETGGRYPFPFEILENKAYAENIGDYIIDPDKKFHNRYDMAEYLNQQLGEDFYAKFSDEVGIWSWLAAVYFDQFCPAGCKVKRREHYILALKGFEILGSPNVAYRHCVRTPFLVYLKFPQIAKAIILGSKDKDTLYEMGDSLEQIMSRHFLYRCVPFQDVIKHLYVNADNLGKPGFTTTPAKHKNKDGKWSKAGYGGIRRLITVFQRLKISYNLREMSPSEIVEKAGREFQKWEEKK